MNESFEDQLRRALRPVDAPQGFAERVRAALPDRTAPRLVTSVTALPARDRGLRRFFMPAALAASLIVAVLWGQHTAVRIAQLEEESQGLIARAQLMQALRVTSQKLDIAYQAVNKPRDASAEENPT